MSGIFDLTKKMLNFPWVKAWIDQFAPSDRETANSVVLNLTFVSETKFANYIKRNLRELCNAEETTAIFCVREIEKNEDYLEIKSNKQETNALIHDNYQGSEAIVLNIIKGFCNTSPQNYLNHPALKRMESRNCNHIILVDDIIGTGNRTNKFIEVFKKSRKFRAWHSLNSVKITVLAYACTETGKELISKHMFQPDIIFDIDCPTIRDIPVNVFTTRHMIQIFTNYGNKTGEPRMSLGYKNSLAMLVFGHGCPNNVPSILWSNSDIWGALFPERYISDEAEELLLNITEYRDWQKILFEIEHIILSSNPKLSVLFKSDELLYLMLGHISNGKKKISTLSLSTNLDKNSCKKILEILKNLKLISPTYQITQSGLEKLKYASEFNDDFFLDVGEGNMLHFPMQMRRPQND